MDMLHKLLMNKYFEIKVEGKSKEKEEKVVEAYDLIIELANATRKLGLLELENRAYELNDKDSNQRFLATLLKLIVNGTESEILAEIGLNFIIADNITAYDGLICLMFFRGSLLIQAGENPLLIADYLKSMIPETCREIIENCEKECGYATDSQDTYDLIQKLCEGNEKLDEKDGSIINQTALVLVALSDYSLQQVLRGVDSICIATAIKALPGIARKRIFDNVSKRYGKMLVEDMQTVYKSEAEQACYQIMKVFVKMEEYCEIEGYDTTVLKFVLSIYDEANKREAELRDKYKSLRKLIDEIYGENKC